jgi:hypothetical protein
MAQEVLDISDREKTVQTLILKVATTKERQTADFGDVVWFISDPILDKCGPHIHATDATFRRPDRQKKLLGLCREQSCQQRAITAKT